MGRRLHWLSSSSFDEVRHSIVSRGPEIERLDLIENTFYYGTVSTLVFQGRDDGPLVQTIDHGAGVSFRLESTSTVRVLVPTAPLELVQAGLSLRSLQIMFRREFDSTIMQYIQRHRLTVARTLLEQARPNQTITSIARAAGFPHLSDFGRVYREMYGETPSETLRRYRPYGRRFK